jgi:cytochrome c peroxidase
MEIPKDNPMTAEKAALGAQLFFDKRLSGDATLSCYSCHLNENGLTDGKALGTGAFGKKLTRSSPTLWNIGYHAEFYWDGRAKSLEDQALAAWKGINMGADPEKVSTQLNRITGYRSQFKKVFNEEASPALVTKALAAYMRTIVSRDTPWDRWQQGDEGAVNDSAKRGYDLFQKARCDQCHGGVLVTSQQYYNVGIGMEAPEPDLGRHKVTKLDKDKGAFKAPTLRDVADSAPYFHDGSVPTLEKAVRLMLGGGIENPFLDRANLKKVDFSEAQIQDLLEFLKSLDEPAKLREPKLPGE